MSAEKPGSCIYPRCSYEENRCVVNCPNTPKETGKPEAAERELAALRDDPNVVHINMLRGTIAKISMMQCAHVHGEETVKQWSKLAGSKE